MTREEIVEILNMMKGAWMMVNDTPKDREAAAFGVKALDAAISALKGPTREQVILCKDCRYWQGNNGGYPHPECRWGNDETPDADDYCSFAERMEVNKNG